MAEIDVTRIAGNIGAMNSLNSLANINKKLSVHQPVWQLVNVSTVQPMIRLV